MLWRSIDKENSNNQRNDGNLEDGNAFEKIEMKEKISSENDDVDVEKKSKSKMEMEKKKEKEITDEVRLRILDNGIGRGVL
uniref:Uncharacterized protein n=1 Tax=Caenorhabditis japonica TaxID=281687 RepID=A0A8R1IUD2_CAEJA